MSPSKHSSAPLLVAMFAGGLLGFALPYLRSAQAQEPMTTPVIAAGDEQTSCSCQTLSCTTSEGSRNLSGPCMARCPEGKVPDCQCGKCADDGRVAAKNICKCKAAE